MPDIRYKLDDLGWFQFEWLVQSLLKANVALGIESWGGTHGDHGRDAYFDGPLAFPTNESQDGAFLFQAKFIASANASGAKPQQTVIQALRKEVSRIKRRIAEDEWGDIRHFTLVTNSPLTPQSRKQVATHIREVLPTVCVTTWSGNDVCDLLDHHPELRRSFPQLLSLRDLRSLLADAVNREVIERSKSALAAAAEYVSTFVPTAAYDRAWSVLREHNFAVLHGPAEMGKTAIAWMIGISQLSNGWEAIVCHSPEDFFKSLEENRKQIFIADDAFGRTEYNPSSVYRWEKDLHYVLQRVDPTHWLVWTSRKHLLERARQSMDLQGKAGRFPLPGSVLVDASKLSATEKALIVYRHAKRTVRLDQERQLIRSHAMGIVLNPNFTPERIRGFVSERMPMLVSSDGRLLVEPSQIESEVAEAINNPTKRMRISFEALDPEQKQLLIAMLQAGSWPKVADVKTTYENYRRGRRGSTFEEVLEQLNEAFITVPYPGHVSWIHASYRDLVIDELHGDADLRREFLGHATRDGLALAVSRLGGPKGERQFPLLVDDADWSAAEARAVQLAAESDVAATSELLESLSFAARSHVSDGSEKKIVAIIGAVLSAARDRWDSTHATLRASELKAYADASLLLQRLPEMPDLTNSWQVHASSALGKMAASVEPDVDAIEEWVDFAEEIQRTEPRFLAKAGFPASYEDQIERLLESARAEIAVEGESDYAADFRERSTRLTSLASSLSRLGGFLGADALRARDIGDRLRARASYFEDEARARDDEEDEHHSDDADPNKDELDLRNIFIDL